jgi:hypothetical protein
MNPGRGAGLHSAADILAEHFGPHSVVPPDSKMSGEHFWEQSLIKTVKFSMKYIFLILVMVVPAVAQDLILELEPLAEPIYAEDFPKFKVAIMNQGSKPVTLVQPGDGSNFRWRTPVVGWSIISADDPEKEHPKTPPLYSGARCGNINAVKSSDVFTLRPGERRILDEWTGHPRFEHPGRYRIRFYYHNIPDLQIRGIPLGKHDAGALRRIQQSHACELISEEIIVEVLPRNDSTPPQGAARL